MSLRICKQVFGVHENDVRELHQGFLGGFVCRFLCSKYFYHGILELAVERWHVLPMSGGKSSFLKSLVAKYPLYSRFQTKIVIEIFSKFFAWATVIMRS